jgi:hypothetical protein
VTHTVTIEPIPITLGEVKALSIDDLDANE